MKKLTLPLLLGLGLMSQTHDLTAPKFQAIGLQVSGVK